MASRIRPLMVAVCVAARSAMRPGAVLALTLLVLGTARAEVVYSNLNTDPETNALAYGFTQFAQRFTTGSAGSGLHLDLNIISGSGAQNYTVELWSADGAGTNANLFLAPIGSGVVSGTDTTALTSFDLVYSLAPSTNYFVKLITSTADFVWVMGPNSSTTLNSIFRYGVDNLNNADFSSAAGMKVDINAVPEPSTSCMALAGITCGGFSMWRRRKRA